MSRKAVPITLQLIESTSPQTTGATQEAIKDKSFPTQAEAVKFLKASGLVGVFALVRVTSLVKIERPLVQRTMLQIL